jgi:hypothetical protein
MASGELITQPVLPQHDHAPLIDACNAGRLSSPCPFRKSYPGVLVMQPSQDRNGDNGTRSLDGSMQGLECKRQPRSNLDSAPYQTKPITAVKVGAHSQAEQLVKKVSFPNEFPGSVREARCI